MQRLVEQLLLLTRADEGAVARNPRDVDLDDLVLAEVRRVRGGEIGIDVAQVRHARVRGDEPALGQVVRNLVDNAARHARSVVAVYGRRRSRTGSSWPSRTTVRGCPRNSGSASSSGSCGSTRPEPVTTGGADSGSRSSQEIVRAHGGSVAVVVVGAWRCAVRRTAAGVPTGPPERAFRRLQEGFSEVLARCGHTESNPPKGPHMFPAKLRSKRIWIPTLAAVVGARRRWHRLGTPRPPTTSAAASATESSPPPRMPPAAVS